MGCVEGVVRAEPGRAGWGLVSYKGDSSILGHDLTALQFTDTPVCESSGGHARVVALFPMWGNPWPLRIPFCKMGKKWAK